MSQVQTKKTMAKQLDDDYSKNFTWVDSKPRWTNFEMVAIVFTIFTSLAIGTMIWVTSTPKPNEKIEQYYGVEK